MDTMDKIKIQKEKEFPLLKKKRNKKVIKEEFFEPTYDFFIGNSEKQTKPLKE